MSLPAAVGRPLEVPVVQQCLLRRLVVQVAVHELTGGAGGRGDATAAATAPAPFYYTILKERKKYLLIHVYEKGNDEGCTEPGTIMARLTVPGRPRAVAAARTRGPSLRPSTLQEEKK